MLSVLMFFLHLYRKYELFYQLLREMHSNLNEKYSMFNYMYFDDNFDKKYLRRTILPYYLPINFDELKTEKSIVLDKKLKTNNKRVILWFLIMIISIFIGWNV